MAYALEALGKDVRLVNADPAPDHYLDFPGVDRIEIARAECSSVMPTRSSCMESSDLARTGVAGLDGRFTINIDHHQGNTGYGALNWLDESRRGVWRAGLRARSARSACPLTLEIATHIYLAILTDTGSFHHSNITPRTFDICRQCVEAGVNPAAMARRVFDSNSFGKLKLIGALLDEMDLRDDGPPRRAVPERRDPERHRHARTTTPRGSSTCR